MHRKKYPALFILSVMMLFCILQVRAQQAPTAAFLDSIFQIKDIPKSACGTDLLLNTLRKDPAFRLKEQQMNDRIQQSITGTIRLSGGTGTTGDPYILPVVVHIISPNPAGISDATITNAIKDLNDAFSKSGAYAASAGADTRIRFALAKKDPDGGLTTGITRVTSPMGQYMNRDIEDVRLKNLIQWDPVRYINVWYITNISAELNPSYNCGVWTRGNVGGYATLPSSVNSTSLTEGIVVTGFGPMLAHEMGHYLSLYHTFEGGCTNNDCTKDGDKVCDTPPDSYQGPSPNCNTPTNSCVTDTLSNYSNGFFPVDVPDQISNFMDYGNTACSNQFTEGQATRMRAAIATQRPGLINDLMNPPCNENIKAYFTRNISDPKVGDAVNFTNASQNTSTYEWLIDGVSKSTSANFSNTFTATGKYKVTLKAYNNTGCVSIYTDYVLVNCGITARFWANKQLIASKAGVLLDTILFTNQSVNNLSPSPTTYTWIITNNGGTGRNIATSSPGAGGPDDLNYVFPSTGSYGIKLIATNGSCTDSTQGYFYAQVLDPTPNANVSIFGVDCFQQTKLRLNIFAYNSGYKYLPSKIPVSFYDNDPRKPGANKLGSTFIIPDSIIGFCYRLYVDTLDVGRTKLDTLYAVIDDAGTTVPISLPNTAVLESNYTDNVFSMFKFRYKVSVTPTVATLKPGDTLRLIGSTYPDPYTLDKLVWSPPNQLSCTTCYNPLFTADSTRTKQLIGTSIYQCYDTATVKLNVIQPDDYTVQINNVSCVSKDSLSVTVTVNSTSIGGGIPKKLPVNIYQGDPSAATAQLLPPGYLIPDSTLLLQNSYTFRVAKNLFSGNLYATVNSNGTAVPVSFSNPPFFEKVTNNNISPVYVFNPVTKVIDTSICNGDTVFGRTQSGTYTDTFKTAGGCDSLRVLKLNVRAAAVTKTTVSIAVCQGQSYAGYTQAGTYVDKFTGVNSCDSIRTLILTVNPVYSKTNAVQICKGSSYFAGGKAQTRTGTYYDTLKSVSGCDSVVITNLTVNSLPANFLPADTIMCIGKTLPLTVSYPSVTWSDGTTGNFFTISQTGAYWADVVDRNGCKGSDTIHVTYTKCIPIQIPTAFTPNKDGLNDIFKPLIGAAITNYKMQIYSRWGQVVFETRDYNKGWDGNYQGQMQQNGTYVYFISFTDPDGIEIMKTGTLLLIR